MDSSTSARANAERHRNQLAQNMLAGSVAISIAVGTFNPLDTLRVRWQVRRTGDIAESGLINYARRIVAQEGLLRGLWSVRSLPTQESFVVDRSSDHIKFKSRE
eukprot:SAG31_NODE_1938_length_6865_cov_15.342595_6_plen_104_part_00